MFPHAVALDQRLNVSDVRVALALLYFGTGNSEVYQSDTVIGSAIGLSRASVQRSLINLEAAGHIERRTTTPRPGSTSSRVLLIRWVENPEYLDPSALPGRRSGPRIGRPLAQVQRQDSTGPELVQTPRIEKGASQVRQPFHERVPHGRDTLSQKGASSGAKGCLTGETQRITPENNQNTNKGGGVGSGDSGKGNAESRPVAAEPSGEVLAKIREQADELRPGSGDELARAAQAAILEGHDPGPVQDLALKALEPNVKFPDRWFRDRLVREAAKSGGTLKAKAEIIDSAARAGTFLETKRQREKREQANEDLQNQLVQGKAAWEQMTPDQRNAYKADYARRNPGAFPGFVERSCLAEIGAALGRGEPIQVPELVQAPPEPTVEPEVQVQTKPRPSKAQEPRPKPRSLGKPRGPVRLADALVGSAGHLIAAQAGA